MNESKPLDRFAQVASSYFQRPAAWLHAACLIGTVICIRLFITPSTPMRLAAADLAVMQVSLIALSATVQVKIQLGDWRTALTPGFRLPHLLLPGMLVLITCVGVPFLISRPVNIQFGPLLAITVLLSACFAWMIHDPVAVLFSIVGYVGITFSLHVTYLSSLFDDQQPPYWFIPCLMAVVAFALLAIHIAFQNDRAVAVRTTNNRAFMAGPLTTVLSKVRFEWSLETSATAKLTGLLSRIRHRRLATFSGAPPVALGGGIAVGTLMMVFIKFFLPPGDAATLPPIMVAYFANLMLMIWAGVVLSNLPPTLSRESLYPASRGAFVREIFMALLWDLLEVWLSACVATVISIALLAREQFSQVMHQVLPMLLFFTASLPLALGLVLWIVIVRKPILTLPALLILMSLSVASVAMQIYHLHMHNLAPQQPGIYTVALSLIGVALTAVAYFQWRTMELP